jgi:glycosyltransferase involved in cell wall biosynthesis
MRVLHIIDMIGAGGKERRLFELLKFLERNYRTEVESRLIVFNKDIYYEDIKTLDIKINYISRNDYSSLRVLKKMVGVIKHYNPDIVHTWGAVPSFFATISKLFCRFKFLNAMVASAPENFFLSQNWLLSRLSFPFSDIILSNSKAGLKAYGAPEKKSRQIYNGFNYSRILNIKLADEIRKELNIPNKKIVGMVATFSDRKDWDTYLTTAKEILLKRDDVIFLCVGDGRNYKRYKTQYSNQQIIFAGNRKDVESVVNIFDIGVLCTYGESLSNSILEYMALGKPVIATDKGGNNEILENGRSGYLFEHKNINDYTQKLSELLDNEGLRLRMGQRSKEIVTEKFSIENMTGNTYELYREMLK